MIQDEIAEKTEEAIKLRELVNRKRTEEIRQDIDKLPDRPQSLVCSEDDLIQLHFYSDDSRLVRPTGNHWYITAYCRESEDFYGLNTQVVGKAVSGLDARIINTEEQLEMSLGDWGFVHSSVLYPYSQGRTCFQHVVYKKDQDWQPRKGSEVKEIPPEYF